MAKLTNSPTEKLRRKLFAGATIRRLREERDWTQLELARRLNISPSYLSQIEASQRSLSGTMVVDLARVFRVNLSIFTDDLGDRLAANLRETLADPLFGTIEVNPRELRTAAVQMPQISRALLDLHAQYQTLEARYRALDEAVHPEPSQPRRPISAFDEVRDFFHFIGNYVDALDLAAEALATRISEIPGDPRQRMEIYLASEHGLSVVECPPDSHPAQSRLEREAGRITLNEALPVSSQVFALARHVARLTHGETADAIVAQAGFLNRDSALLCSAALSNYFAGALTMPYGAFRDEARRMRHDVERLAIRFGASLEQVCHRLSTLQRSGQEGVPMYFLRVDRAGNITKRHSATRFQFARYGGACPIWNIHEAFEMPDRFLVQRAEMPDGRQYLSIARAISKGESRFDAVRSRYAIGIGCEMAYADELIYADAIRSSGKIAEIGINCRLCERPDCPQRAVPPLDRAVIVDPWERGILPYRLG